MSSFYAAISFLLPSVNGNLLRFISQRAPCAGLYYDGSRCHAVRQAEDEIIRRPNGLEQDILHVYWTEDYIWSLVWQILTAVLCSYCECYECSSPVLTPSKWQNKNVQLGVYFPTLYHGWFHTVIDPWLPDPKNHQLKAQPRSSFWGNHRQHHW